MIPSTLAAEVSDALEDFLSTGFGPSNPALSGVVEQFLADPDNLFKGPYLSVDLPFRHAPEGGEPFPETPLGFTPWRHQRNAFNRLSRGQSTVIATGTGSGKTECFLYPVLDHCRAQAGAPGVKAIVIYPMNALASDQARRIAGIVDRTPSLHGKVTAGLYVGETLELGVDIGDLSTVVMCSVPPAPVNYVQRTGRAGRRDGNALTLTVATGQPHDLYYYTEPMEMLGSRIDPPGVFLNAPAVLERQLTAFCLDCWVAAGVDESAVPRTIRAVLNNVERTNTQGFPYPLLDYVAEHGDDLLARFVRAFEARSGTNGGIDDASRRYLSEFLHGADLEDSLRLRILKCLTEVVKERQSLRNNVDTLGRRIRAIESGPSDEANRKTIKELSDERRALRELLRTLNGQDTFGFLTDEGLLPNYAFPQEGVTLKSVIFKRRQAEEGEAEAEEDDIVVYEYPRPAAAALGEFAPQNEFYAGGGHSAHRHAGVAHRELASVPVLPLLREHRSR